MESVYQEEILSLLKEAIINNRQFTDDESQFFDQMFEMALTEVEAKKELTK